MGNAAVAFVRRLWEVTRIFEQAWYGGRQMDKQDYQALETQVPNAGRQR